MDLSKHPNRTLPLARVDDRALRVWGAASPDQKRGVFTAREQARLVLELPSMAAEALVGRLRHPLHPDAPQLDLPIHMLQEWAGPWRLTVAVPLPDQHTAIIGIWLEDLVGEIMSYRHLERVGDRGEVAA